MVCESFIVIAATAAHFAFGASQLHDSFAAVHIRGMESYRDTHHTECWQSAQHTTATLDNCVIFAAVVLIAGD
jgi:hypothetical protein